MMRVVTLLFNFEENNERKRNGADTKSSGKAKIFLHTIVNVDVIE